MAASSGGRKGIPKPDKTWVQILYRGPMVGTFQLKGPTGVPYNFCKGTMLPVHPKDLKKVRSVPGMKVIY